SCEEACKTAECAPGAPVDPGTRNRGDQPICERTRGQEMRDAGDGSREAARTHPQPARVGEAEVEQVRDRQRTTRRRPVAQGDAEQCERNRTDEECRDELD